MGAAVRKKREVKRTGFFQSKPVASKTRPCNKVEGGRLGGAIYEYSFLIMKNDSIIWSFRFFLIKNIHFN